MRQSWQIKNSRAFWAFALLAVGFSLIFWLVWGNRGGGERLVVYCAHDSVYSEEILREFTAQSGIEVDVKFDTEATKSLGLVEQIASERGDPQCDVFWNNELLGTVRLADSGCLESYLSPNASRFPDRFKEPSGLWTGFAGRLRVFIINTDQGELTDEQIGDTLNSQDLSRVAIAKPLYGTTLTHYAALWQELGPEKLKEWHRQSRENGLIEANGNAAVKDLVAQGVCKIGFTDTDDTFAAIDAGHPVKMNPVRLPSGDTICIPNTVSVIKGCPHPVAAQKLVDFLLSEETEVALARSRSRQIPLGTLADQLAIPEEVQTITPWASDSVDLRTLADSANACLTWLKSL